MATVTCPYCNSNVDEAYLDKICPACGEYVKSEEWLCEQALAYIRRLKKNNVYDRIKILVWNEEFKIATNEIILAVGKQDAPAAKMAIEKIYADRPNNWQRSEAPMARSQTRTEKPIIHLIECEVCENKISPKAESCPHCGNPTGVHVCPKCNSINTKVITGTSKAASIFLWGAFAANKVVSKFECKDCGHKF